MFTKDELINFLRSSVIISDKTEETEYLSLSDEDLTLYLRVALTKDFPEVDDIEEVENSQIYTLMLSAKMQLFQSLAIKYANKVDLTADNANSLKLSQKYEHFKGLYEGAKSEYDDYIANGGAEGFMLHSAEVLLSTRYRTKRNYERGSIPVIHLSIGSVSKSSIELDWELYASKFANYKVYISTESFFDPYVDPHTQEVKPCKEITDVHHNYIRIEGLKPSTTYFVVVSCTDLSGHTGYSKQLSVSTLDEEVVVFEG